MCYLILATFRNRNATVTIIMHSMCHLPLNSMAPIISCPVILAPLLSSWRAHVLLCKATEREHWCHLQSVFGILTLDEKQRLEIPSQREWSPGCGQIHLKLLSQLMHKMQLDFFLPCCQQEPVIRIRANKAVIRVTREKGGESVP